MDDRALARAVVDPQTYVDQSAYDALFTPLRRSSPVRWVAPEGYRPFWLVTRHADIVEIERQPERFLNGPRSTLATLADEEKLARLTGRRDSALRTLVNMDDPDHRLFRAITQVWFMPPNLQKLDRQIAVLAREFVDRMEAMGGACDFARDIANWYPLRVIMTILGVPAEDEAFMLRLTQELLGSTDPEMRRHGARRETFKDFFAYFARMTADRRRSPRDDVATVIANATLDGRPIGPRHDELDDLGRAAGPDADSGRARSPAGRARPARPGGRRDDPLRLAGEAFLPDGERGLCPARPADQGRRQPDDVLSIG